MNKSRLFLSDGFSYIETVVSIAILGIVIISTAGVITMIGKASAKNKQIVKANQFANAIIDNLRERSRYNFEGIMDDVVPYEELMGVPIANNMTAELSVTLDGGTKEVDIKILWNGAGTGNIEMYYTRINQRGVAIQGGILKGRIVYVKQLDTNNRIPVVPHGSAQTPFTMYDESKAHLYAGAAGMTVKALSNDDDGSYVITRSNKDGEFLLKNVLKGGTLIYFYKEGSKPNESEIGFEQAFYFFELLDPTALDPAFDPNCDIPSYQKGYTAVNVNFSAAGEEIDIGEVVCARAWRMFISIGYKGLPLEEFDPTPYQEADMLRITGGLWGISDSYETGQTSWDFSDKLMTTPYICDGIDGRINRTDVDSTPLESNLIINNVRQALQDETGNHFYIRIDPYIGSDPDVARTDPTYSTSTLQGGRYFFVAPFYYQAPFVNIGRMPEFPSLVAPSPGFAGDYPLSNHTENFINTTLLVDTNTYTATQGPDSGFNCGKIRIQRAGWIEGKVVDHLGNPVPDVTVHNYFRNYPGGGDQRFYATTDAQGNFKFENFVHERTGYSFKYLSWSFMNAYDEQFPGRFGLVETVKVDGQWLNFTDPNARVWPNQKNEIIMILYPGVELSGTISTIADPGGSGSTLKEFDVYMSDNGQYSTAVVVTGTNVRYDSSDEKYKVDYSFNQPVIRPRHMKGSVARLSCPIGVKSTDPNDELKINIDITLTDKESGAPIDNCLVQVHQYYFDGMSWYVDWAATGNKYKSTDNSGKIDSWVMANIAHEGYFTDVTTNTAVAGVALTNKNLENVDHTNVHISRFYFNHDDYINEYHWYYEGGWECFDESGNSIALPGYSSRPPASLPDNSTIRLTHALVPIGNSKITFTLTFHDKELEPSIVPVDVDQITIVHNDGTENTSGTTYTPGTPLELRDDGTISVTVQDAEFYADPFLLKINNNNGTIRVPLSSSSGM